MKVSYKSNFKSDTQYEILCHIDKVCKENGLTYFAYGELLAGAVHYNDFIPNDGAKAQDVALLRKDYDKLVPILRESLENTDFVLDEYYGDHKTRKTSMRLGKHAELDIEEALIKDTFWIHIAAFDAIPDPYDLRIGYFRRVRLLNRKYERVRKRNSKKLKGKFVSALITKVRKKITPVSKIYDKLIKTVTKYEDQNMGYVGRMTPKRSKMIAMEDLLPLQKIPFRDMELPCPKVINTWTAVMDEALLEQVQSIQKLDLILLKEFDSICRKLNIGYFVCGGTMLGYMRHGGFIPWDDDIDVGMLREDYDRFLREAGPYLKPPFFLQTRQSDPKIPYLFSKIRLDNTEYITEYNEKRDFHKGICLDLFPFDAIPNDPKEEKAFLDRVYAKVKYHNKITNRANPEPGYTERSRDLEEFWYRILGKVYRKYYNSFSFAKTQKAYIDEATRYNKNWKELGYTRVASFVPSYTYIEREDLLPYQDVKFEGLTVKVPNKPDVFLTMQYGDYMQLPPKHKQAGHELIRWSADLEKVVDAKENEVK